MILTEIVVFFHTKKLFIVAIASCHYENWKLDKNSPSSIGLKKKKLHKWFVGSSFSCWDWEVEVHIPNKVNKKIQQLRKKREGKHNNHTTWRRSYYILSLVNSNPHKRFDFASFGVSSDTLGFAVHFQTSKLQRMMKKNQSKQVNSLTTTRLSPLAKPFTLNRSTLQPCSSSPFSGYPFLESPKECDFDGFGEDFSLPSYSPLCHGKQGEGDSHESLFHKGSLVFSFFYGLQFFFCCLGLIEWLGCFRFTLVLFCFYFYVYHHVDIDIMILIVLLLSWWFWSP